MPYADPIKRRECNRKAIAKWTAANRDRVREYQREWRREWREKNPDLNKTTKKKSYLKHRAHNIAKMRSYHQSSMLVPEKKAKYRADRIAWKKANPEKQRISSRRMLTLRRQAVGTYTNDQWFARVAFYGWRCAYCLCELTIDTLTTDHIIPIIGGGTNWPSNLAPACRSCNVRKNRNRLLPRWLRRKES